MIPMLRFCVLIVSFFLIFSVYFSFSLDGVFELSALKSRYCEVYMRNVFGELLNAWCDTFGFNLNVFV